VNQNPAKIIRKTRIQLLILECISILSGAEVSAKTVLFSDSNNTGRYVQMRMSAMLKGGF